MCISLVLETDSPERFGATTRPSAEAEPGGAAPPPVLEPGQLWMIEVSPEGDPSECVRRAISTANVVIYDRPLTALVAAVLPPGGYAEPAAATGGKMDPVCERCVCFARDGWSVVRLVTAASDRLTLLIDAAGGGAAPRLHAVAANGLAG